MESLNEQLSAIESLLTGPWFIFLLLGTGLFFTIFLGFPQVRYFIHAFRIVRGKFDRPDAQGDTSHFQSLATALSGTVGTGNIAGVAFAVHLGGPAALFWMVVTAFLGMTSKFVEVTLSHKYREIATDGSIAGGPMYFMKNKLKLPWLAAIFAVATVISSFGTGNLPQINGIANAIEATFSIDKMLTGGVLAILMGLVILGGIKRIAKVTERLVPAMALIYLVGALAVIFANLENLWPSFVAVFSPMSIFSGTAASGGFLGATLAYAFNRGVNRGLFSNEAGQGSAPIAHAAARAKEPVSEGMVAILEPFIDTIVICTLTGLVLLSSGVWNEKFLNDFQSADLLVLDRVYDENDPMDQALLFDHLNDIVPVPAYTGSLRVQDGQIQDDLSLLHARSIAEQVAVRESTSGATYTGVVEVKDGKISDNNITVSGKSLIHSAPLTSEAFKRGLFGEAGQYIISIGLLLFAFSTALSWSYYGDRAMYYLFGEKLLMGYRVVYVIVFFIGSFVDTTIIWTIAGIAIVLMAVPNLIGILLLSSDMKKTVAAYWEYFHSTFPDVYKRQK
ncbi:MAG: alanine/glycine:cation symporter family protein [Bernardetiaceae bacterium]